MAYGWEGQLTRLVPLRREDHFENALRWLNDPEVTQYLLVGDLPVGSKMEEEHFDRATGHRETDASFAIETLDGKHIGFSGVHKISYKDGHAITGSLIGDLSNRGKGYGSDAAKVRTRYCFEVLNLQCLTSDVSEHNISSLKMLIRAGYRECGYIPRRYWKRGRYHGAKVMVCLRDEWEKSHNIPE